MTPQRWLLIGLIVLVVVVAGIGGFSYVQEQKARAALEAELKSEQAQLDALNAAIATRDQAAQARVKAAQAEAARIQTPVQAIPAFPSVVQLPVAISMPLPTAQEPRPDAILPNADILPLFQKLETCKENDILLGTCQVDRETLRQETALLTKERDQAVATVHGGTFWQRFTRNTKWVAVVAGVGLGAYEAGRLHH